IIVGRDVLLLAGSGFLAPRGLDVEVNTVGKAATWILYAAIAFRIVTSPATKWPLYLFWAGLVLAVAAGVFYAFTARRELRRGRTSSGRGEGARGCAPRPRTSPSRWCRLWASRAWSTSSSSSSATASRT